MHICLLLIFFSQFFPDRWIICLQTPLRYKTRKKLLLDEERKESRKTETKTRNHVLKVWERFHQMSLKILLEKLFGLESE
jgi:hypothetical protein